MQEGVQQQGEHPAGNDVDGVMGVDIDGAETQQDVERHEQPEEAAVARLPSQEHEDGGHPHVTAGEGRRRPFASRMRIDHHLIEHPAGVTRRCQGLTHGHEVVVQVGEHALCDLVCPYGLKIELRSAHW